MRRKIRLASSSWEIASSDSISWCSQSPTMSPVQRHPGGRGYGLPGGAFQRFDELFELRLVGEGDLEAIRDDPAGEAADPVGRALGARDESRIELRLLPARLRLGAGPAGSALRSAYRHPLLDDLARQCAAALVVGNREHGTRVTLGQLPALEHLQDVLGQLEQAHAVGDRGLRLADLLG